VADAATDLATFGRQYKLKNFQFWDFRKSLVLLCLPMLGVNKSLPEDPAELRAFIRF